MLMDPQMRPGLFIRFLGTLHGTSTGGMAATYSELTRLKAAGTLPLVPQTQQKPKQAGPSLPLCSRDPAKASGVADLEPLDTVPELGTRAKAEAAKRAAYTVFDELCSELSDPNDPCWGLLEEAFKQLQQNFRRIAAILLQNPAAPPVSNTNSPGGNVAKMQLAAKEGGRHEATAGNQSLCLEPPERTQPSGVEPWQECRLRSSSLPWRSLPLVSHKHQSESAARALWQQAQQDKAAGRAEHLQLIFYTKVPSTAGFLAFGGESLRQSERASKQPYKMITQS